MTERPSTSGKSYFARYWRGELSLARSLWINQISITIYYILVVVAIHYALVEYWPGGIWTGSGKTVYAFLSALSYPMLLALEVWCTVGTLRAARQSWRSGKRARPIAVLLSSILILGLTVACGIVLVYKEFDDGPPQSSACLAGNTIACAVY
ncbi:MAG: hypothetical protein PHE27_05825 [Alphaproteobacteria bacterium]|nr:hypothetical protein [Alphaproteobacteria bacterium]